MEERIWLRTYFMGGAGIIGWMVWTARLTLVGALLSLGDDDEDDD